MGDFTIDTPDRDDSAELARMHVAAWQAAYLDILPASLLQSLSVSVREAAFQRQLAAGEPKFLVARKADRIVGFVSFGQSRDAKARADAGEIHALYVASSCWRNGIGRALMRSACTHLYQAGKTTIMLWVLADNARALAFYAAAGFQRDPVPPQYMDFAGAARKLCRLTQRRSDAVD